MDLVYHVMKSPLILSDQHREAAGKSHLYFTQNLCKIRKSDPQAYRRDDTDAIVKFITENRQCQCFSFIKKKRENFSSKE